MKIGLKIRELRKLRGLTQEKLGELSGCTKQLICNYENGTPVPSDRLTVLARIFDVSVQVFIESEGQVKESTNSELVEELRSTLDFLKGHIINLESMIAAEKSEKQQLFDLLKGNFQEGNECKVIQLYPEQEPVTLLG